MRTRLWRDKVVRNVPSSSLYCSTKHLEPWESESKSRADDDAQLFVLLLQTETLSLHNYTPSPSLLPVTEDTPRYTSPRFLILFRPDEANFRLDCGVIAHEIVAECLNLILPI